MPRRIEDEIQENRRQTRRLASYRREPATRQATTLAFAPIDLVASIETTVSTRPLNDTCIGGAPGPNQAGGTGVGGDQRGSWTQVATTSSGGLLDAGETAIAEALAGQAIGLEHVDAGAGPVDAWYVKTDSDTTTAVGVVPVTDLPDQVSTVGVADQDERGLLEATSVGVDPATDEEVKVEVAVTLSPDTTGEVAVTDLDSVTDLLATEAETGGIKHLAIGTDSTAPATSDTALGTEQVRKEVTHDTQGGRLTLSAAVFRSEPNDNHDFDVVELGAFFADGDLAWRRTFDPEQKDERIRLALSDGVDPR